MSALNRLYIVNGTAQRTLLPVCRRTLAQQARFSVHRFGRAIHSNAQTDRVSVYAVTMLIFMRLTQPCFLISGHNNSSALFDWYETRGRAVSQDFLVIFGHILTSQVCRH